MPREWESFYTIMGSAAAALTGLQFVVIALGAGSRSVRDPEAVEAFATPTIVHFSVVLTVAALMVVPRQTALSLAICFGGLGLSGVAYTIITALRARRQTGYQPVFEDWLWHVGLPTAAYAMLFGAGVAGALTVIAAAALLLLLIGIHNAWDSAVYISLHHRDDE
ncbi:MAG TPA: hypothetical protein VJZ76_11800 [Thermoanaerobaculia bacterium]|nr:hypothetical protein [Thermoanaerobaculia bacterium]